MGMECVRSSSPLTLSFNSWLHQHETQSPNSTSLPNSASTNSLGLHPASSLFSVAACRRASSFPLAHSAALPSALKVRSQSESAALNSINIKVPRNLFHELEMCRQKLVNGSSPTRFSNASFYTPIQDGIQSDSEGDDSLVSSEDGGSSSSAGCEEEHDVEDDLGVVRDLELDDDHRHCHLKTHLEKPSSPPTLCFVYEPPQPKKSVRFADECVIRRYRKAAAAASSTSATAEDEEEEEDSAARQPRSSWKMAFKQPASEYVKFRESLETQKVALENVMLKNDIGRMVGTIKVSNISFEKRVFIRFTSDGWKSFLDRPAAYQSSPSKAYDTFRFDVELPRNTEKDSKISSACALLPMPPAPSAAHQASSPSPLRTLDRDDAYRLESNDWARFASWKNLSTSTPYY
uniref:CBM21 domain-containing protein n=1 Tax=Ditylenchus dipsaci TaxID=166011 RepID=A0A915D7K7_9BILA